MNKVIYGSTWSEKFQVNKIPVLWFLKLQFSFIQHNKLTNFPFPVRLSLHSISMHWSLCVFFPLDFSFFFFNSLSTSGLLVRFLIPNPKLNTYIFFSIPKYFDFFSHSLFYIAERYIAYFSFRFFRAPRSGAPEKFLFYSVCSVQYLNIYSSIIVLMYLINKLKLLVFFLSWMKWKI